MPANKVLVIGSGPIKIGEAAEFDYSGSQALKALKEEKIKSILINPNVATVQTSYKMADKVYLLPISIEYVKRVIEKEKPDSIMIGFGGQTALDLGIELDKSRILKKYKIANLGTPISGIEKALSRSKFVKTMREHGIETPPSIIARSEGEAMIAGKKLGYPLIVRASFNLGGRGSAIVWNSRQLGDSLRRAFSNSRDNEILIEKYLEGWKEVEYEVVRDSYGTTAVVACIENLDPMGVHTGESVAVTPAQTLDNYEYQEMRNRAIEVAEIIGLIGECNVQFAIDPRSYKYYVIETNPRMSRSSALASKSTGYPLAYVSAKLALGYRIYDVVNGISKKTSAFFEPSLDYITIKAPRWDFEKFGLAENVIGSEMKSIGEVMGIGRNFEEAFQKSVRMLDIDRLGVFGRIYNSEYSIKEIEHTLSKKGPYWQLHVAKAFKMNLSVGRVSNLTGIDRFYLEKIKRLVDEYKLLKGKRLGAKDYTRLKGLGFSDLQLGMGGRKNVSVKQIDTLAGEVPARTNYLYTTNIGSEDDLKGKKQKRLLIVGAGVFRIGVSVEFDWGSISLLDSAKKYFDSTAVVNYNPETVSTDWDYVGELYFDEVSCESIVDIYKKMNFTHIATFTGGQLGNNLCEELSSKKVNILGTSGKSIGIAENRSQFSKLVERLGVVQPEWTFARSISEAKKFADHVGFPVVIRPSHMLGGSAIRIASNFNELETFIINASIVSDKYPVVVSKYIEGIESEMDCASDGENVIGITSYQIEESGVHSGDSTVITPFYDLSIKRRLEKISLSLANELNIRGPFNIQFIIKDRKPFVVELNLRASRSMPFSSKSVGIDIVDRAVEGIFGKFGWNGFYEPDHKSFAVKSPQFVWGQMSGCYPYLGPDMRSTGESAALGKSVGDALLKSWLGAKPNKIPERATVVYGKSNADGLKKAAELLSKVAKVYTVRGAEIEGYKSMEADVIARMLAAKKIDAVFTDGYMRDLDYKIRRTAADMNVPLVLNGKLGAELAATFQKSKLTYGEMSEYWR